MSFSRERRAHTTLTPSLHLSVSPPSPSPPSPTTTPSPPFSNQLTTPVNFIWVLHSILHDARKAAADAADDRVDINPLLSPCARGEECLAHPGLFPQHLRRRRPHLLQRGLGKDEDVCREREHATEDDD